MKEFGKFRPLDPIITDSSLNQLHLSITSWSDLEEHPDQTIVICKENIDEFKCGDVLIKTETGWVTIESLKGQIAGPSQLHGYRKDHTAYIHWRDPDPLTDRSGRILVNWTKTILVRKYGSAPESIKDGEIILETTVKNQFADPQGPAYEDYVPVIDNEANFVYRAFAVADNGVIVSSSAFELIELDWTNVRLFIHNGRAREIFAPGDVFTLNEIELVVASIDTVQAPTSYRVQYPHLVTFLFKYKNLVVPFDLDNEGNRLQPTRDTYAVYGKNYYKENGSLIRAILPGDRLAKLGYTVYEVTSQTRADYGSNIWKDSDIREWCNLVRLDDASDTLKKWLDLTGSPEPPMVYIQNRNLELSSCIIQSAVATRKSLTDGSEEDLLLDRFFLPSYTEVTGKPNLQNPEGQQFLAFKDEVIKPSEFGIETWWLRSTYSQNPDSGIYNMTMTGNEEGNDISNKSHACVLAFSIG